MKAYKAYKAFIPMKAYNYFISYVLENDFLFSFEVGRGGEIDGG